MLGLLNLKILAGVGLAALLAVGAAGYKGYSYGYELAELRCDRRVQAIKDEVAERNAKIRDEAARRRAEVDRLMEKRIEDAKAAARRDAEARHRNDEYEAEIARRGDKCPLTEEDVRALE